MHYRNVEQLVAFALLGIIAALSVPAYGRIVANLSARGVILAWYQHVALGLLTVFAAICLVVAFGVVLAAIGLLAESVGNLVRKARR